MLPGSYEAAANTNVPRAGEVLLLDGGTLTSGVLAVNTQSASVRQVTSQGNLDEPKAIAWGERKRIFVGEGDRIYKVNPYDGPEAAVPWITHPYLREIVDIVRDPDGGFWVLDQRADPLSQGRRGALFHYDPGTDEIELVITSPYFDSPTSIVTEQQGTLLLMDPTGRIDEGGARVGAIYRLDPEAYTVEPLTTLSFGILPVAFTRLDPTTLLLVDSNFSVPGMPALGGAVLKVSSYNFTVLDTLAIPEFREPIDAVPMGDGTILVADIQADSGGSTFLIDGTTGELIREIDSTIFAVPGKLDLLEGACLDNSVFSVTLLDGDELRPGGRLRLRAELINSGELFTGDFRLTINAGVLDVLLGTAEVPSGTVSWDPDAAEFHWDGSLGAGAVATVTFEALLPRDAAPGGNLLLPVDLVGERVETHSRIFVPVGADLLADKLFILDVSRNAPAPRLYSRAGGALTPLAVPEGILTQPIDIAFGPDGSLYVMDRFEGGVTVKIHRVDLLDGLATQVWSGSPLSRAARSLVIGHDGQLLVADPRPGFGGFISPGIIWELDPVTATIDTFFVHEDLIDPYDIVPAQEGRYLIVDANSSMLASNPEGGGLFLLDRDGELISRRSSPLFEQPVSGVAKPDGRFLVVDQQPSSNPLAPQIFEVSYAGTWGFTPILTGITHPLEKPDGIESVYQSSIEDGFWVCETQNGLYSGDTGMLVRFYKEGANWFYSTENASYDQLRSPGRVAVYKAPRNYISSYALEDPPAGPYMPGDTAVVVATVFNNSPIPSTGASAEIRYSGAVEFLDAIPDYGAVVSNPEYETLAWSGNLAYAEDTDIRCRFLVQPPPTAFDLFSLEFELAGVAQTRTVSDTIMAPPVGGELIVLDQRADPFGEEHLGGIYMYAPGTERFLPYASHWRLERPNDVLALSERELVILDGEADLRPPDENSGSLFSLDLESGVLSFLASYSDWVEPNRLVPTPEGTWLIIDTDAEILAGDARGVLYEFDPEKEEELALSLLSVSPAYRNLSDLTLDEDGHIWLADLAANPGGGPGQPGAIFKLDRESGQVLETFASDEIPEPTGILYVPGEGLLVNDPNIRDEFNYVGIRRFDPETGEFTKVASSPDLVRPGRMMLWDDRVVIVDRFARLSGAPNYGTLFELNLALNLVRPLASHPSTLRLWSLTQVPTPDAGLVSFAAAEDSSGRYASWGDTLHCEVVVANAGRAGASGLALEVAPSVHLRFDPESGWATQGEAWVTSSGMAWTGALAGGDTVRVGYSAIVRSDPELSAFARQEVVLTGPEIEQQRVLRHHISTTVGAEELVLIDSRANPLGLQGGGGALFRFAEPNRVPVPILADSSLVSPVAVERIPGSDREFLILDANATVGGQSSGGALFRANTVTGEVELVYYDEDLIEPRSLALVDSAYCYLLDEAADPLGYTPGIGPGALFRVNMNTWEGEVAFSDTVASKMTDIVYDPFRKSILIVDREMEGVGSYQGGVIELFLEPEDPEEPWRVVARGQPFESPRAMEVSRDSTWVLIDYADRQSLGVLYSLFPDGSYQSQGFCNTMVDPIDLVFDVTGELFMIDRNADPQGFGENTGVIYQRSSSGLSACTVFRSGPPLVNPRAADSNFDPTPVLMRLFELAEASAGVELRWSPPSTLTGAHFYVYRRSVEDPASLYEVLHTQPLTGGGELHYLDEAVYAGELYAYKLVASLPDGSHQAFGPLTIRVQQGLGPMRFGLERVYPSPVTFAGGSEGITIRYTIPSPGGPVRLGLFDVTGRLVHWIVDRPVEPGAQVAAWDGRDGRGAPVESGIYFLRLESGMRVIHRRLVMVR